MQRKFYLRFLAMTATGMVVMYAVTYMNTFELDHVRWSEQRLFMVLLMGSSMAIVMLGWMLGMYRNWKANMGIVIGAERCSPSGRSWCERRQPFRIVPT